jgi:carboxypeptidase family protein
MKCSISSARRYSPLLLRSAIGIVSLSLAVLVGCSQLFAQGSAGRILGSVTDQTGGAVVGATVTIVDTQRNLTRTLTTDAAGEYNAPNLLPSTYTVSAAFQGFKTAQRAGVTLEVNQDLRIDLTLQPGEQSEKVTVTGELPLVETTNAVVGGTIQNNVINDLPLNGRNFTNLLVLRPGTVKYAGGSGWTQSTNGLRPHDQNYQVDGIDSNDPWMAQSVMNAVMAAGDAGTMLPIDAIDEFRTEQNPEAQYGWKPGGVINVGVKSGTNNIHGTAYAYGRDNSFDARSFFNPPPVNGVCAVGPLAACDQAALNLEQFGASIGGPILKDKLFYFANYEQQQYTNGNPAPHDVPITSGPGATTDSVNGLIGACLAAGPKLSPLSAQLAGLSTTCTPLPNFPGFFPAASGAAGAPATLVTSLNSTTTIHSGIAKVDYHINAKNSVDASYFISPGSGIFVDGPTTEIANQWLTNQYARSQVFSGTWTYTPSSTWVNEFRGGYSHYYQVFLSNDYSQNPASYNYNGATYNIYTGQTDIGTASSPAFGGLPQIQLRGYSMEFGLNWPKYVGPDGVLNIVDHVSYLHGAHSFMWGFEFLNNASTNAVTQYAKGQVVFKGLDNFFTGNVFQGHFAVGNFNDWQRQLSSQGYAAFIQDSWHVTPRLTFNYGLRYELDTVLKDANNLLGNFDPTLGLVQVGQQISSPYNGDHNNFAPRVGLAWDIFGNGKTVLRASGDIMYEQFSFDTMNALGNLLGSRTVPTGATYAYTNPATGLPVITQGTGSIKVGAVTYGPGPSALGPGGTWSANSPTTPLFSATPACGDGTVTLPDGEVPVPCEIEGIARNLRNPYVTMWTVDLQRAITTNLSLDLAYVGNHGTDLLGLTDLNQPPVGAGWGSASDPTSPLAGCIATPGPTACAPSAALEVAASPYGAKFPYLSYIDWLSNLGESNYDALQVTLTQRASHGLSFIAGYTYSHALDMSSDNWGAGFVSPINAATVGNLYGNSLFDITHNFTFSTTYALPGRKGMGQILEGWSLNSVVTLQSGMPWGVNDFTTDFSGTNEIGASATEGEWWNFYGNPKDFQSTTAFLNTNGGTGGIPYFPGNCAGDCTALPGTPGGPAMATANATCNAKAAALGPAAVASLATLGCYANGGSVLIPPAYGTLGNSGRDNFRGFPFYEWDLSITKDFKFRERLTAQFRAEAFNILNRVNFSNVFGGPGGDNTYTDPTAAAGASFGFRPQTPDITSSNPTLGQGGPRAIQLGLKLIF